MIPGTYRHFKGNEYEVIDVVHHSETHEELVLYKPLYGERKLWVRPVAMFNEMVQHEGQMVPRFTFLSDSIPY